MALIVPIGVAVWTVRSSAKDTAKQIAALEESTTKQIESKNQKEIIISITSLSKTLRISEKVLSRIRRNWIEAYGGVEEDRWYNHLIENRIKS